MNRYGYVRKEKDTLSGVRAYMVKMYLPVEKYTCINFLTAYNNVCINFVTYKFCYRINNVCINFVTV
jgi:hypothetical protein